MKKKKLAKILTLVLSVALILTGLVLAVSAEEEAPEFDLKSAIENADGGDTIVLTGNAELSTAKGVNRDYGISIKKTLTIDLNGYTLNCPDTHRVFNLNTPGVTLTLTGSGTINVGGALMYNATETSMDPVDANIMGSDSGIVINHTGTATKSDGTSPQKMLFCANKGLYTFKNIRVKTTSVGDNIFKNNSMANLVFDQVEINATVAGSGKASIIYTAKNGSVSLDWCKISTLGHSAIGIADQSNKVENFVTVKNSSIYVAYGNDGFSSLIYNSYQSIGSDVVFENSYLNWNSRILIKHTKNGSALTFKNCDLVYNGKGGSWFRSSNVKIEDGTRLWSNHTYYLTDTQFFTNYDNEVSMTVGESTGVYMVIAEGTRFDAATYNKLINPTGATKDKGDPVTYYEEGKIVYPDGSSPASSTTYKMIYDIAGDPTTPYVVVKSDVAGTADAYPFLLHETTTNFRTIWHGTGVSNTIVLNDGNVIRRWTSNGKKNADGANPNTYVGFSTGVLQSTRDVFVYDLDISADSANGFVATGVSLHARSSSSAGSGSGRQTNILNIDSNGTTTVNGVSGGAESVKLVAGEWNHITVVIDATVANKGVKYVYVNGVYMGKGDAYTADDSYLFGIRFDIKETGVLDTNATIITDNMSIRGYGDGSSTTAITDNGQSYLINDGMAWNEGTVNNTFNVAGIAVNDINEALVLNREQGLNVVITAPITHPVCASENGKIYANGNTLVFTEDSYPADVHYNSDGTVKYYDIDSKLADYKVTYKYFLGTLESQKSNPAYWESVDYNAGSIPGIYEAKLLDMMFTNQGDGTYLYHTQKGWAKTFGAADVDSELSDALDAEYVKANSGTTIELYPVFNEGTTHKYHWLVKRTDGSVRFAHTTTGMYGSDWTTRGLNGTGIGGDGSAAVKLEYGETFVVLTDNLYFASTFESLRATKDTAEELVFNFDINGHDIFVDSRRNNKGDKLWGMFVPKENETINIYSSVPGASIDSYGYNNGSADEPDYTISGGVFALNTAENSVINIGKVTVNGVTHEGENLTVMSDQIAQSAGTDNAGGAINIEGCTLVRSTNNIEVMFNTRLSTSPINVKNCTIVIPNGGNLVGNHSSANDFEQGGEINFTDSTIITASNGANLIGNLKNNNKVSFIGCVTNGRINVVTGKVTVKDTAAADASLAAPEGYVLAKYNVQMDLDALIDVYYNTTDGTKNADVTANTFSIAGYGYEGEASLVLPILAYKYVPAENAVKVTWSGLGTNESVTEDYVIGGNVVAPSIADCKLNALKLVHDGGFDAELATGIQADATYTPTYTVESNLSGLKANLSLYSDFLVNLYIPADLAQYITEINGEALAEGTVSFGEASFVKAIVAKSAKEASDDATFEIAIKEGEYTATKTVKISIADYAAQILAGEQFSDTDKALMYYMLNYAAEAAEYLEGAADEEIAKLLADNAKWNVITVEKTFANAVENVGLDSIFTSSGITLNAAPAFTFTPNGKFTGTVTVTYGDGNVRTYTVSEGSTAKVVVEGMKIYNFGTNLTVTAVGTIAGVEGEQTVTGTINLDTYAKYHTENAANEESATKAESAEALDLINALYDYVKVAEQYKAGTLSIPSEGGEGEAIPEPAPAE